MNLRDYLTGGIIREAVELASVDSTNTYALEAGLPGLLVTAYRQTAGRGRQGRAWFSPEAGNIYLTLTLGITDPRLTITAGVAAHETASAFLGGGEPLEIKWPNDLIAGRRKLCGILCETRGDITAVGIGLNVGSASWPEELEGSAVSLAELAGLPLDREQVQNVLIHTLEHWVGIFIHQGFKRVRERFLRHGRLARHELVTEQGQPCTILDMNEDGHLIIDVAGVRETLVSGTIVVRS
jgi:BirA family transcriptional regulator, biotin operon repressor / biotin---[acetyl-CoA-carboxylase] ligase